jgi:hypothetical protein
MPLIFGMNMRQLMALVVKEVQVNDDAVNMLMAGMVAPNVI